MIRREPHGPVRGIYDAAVRPGSAELWVAHIMLGIDTPQPDLNFRQTVFPALSIFDGAGTQQARLSVAPNPGDGQAFGDIVSGPHAIAFSDDGALAFVADSNSEDVLIVDAAHRVESQIIRPLPGHTPEGIVWAGGKIYVQERNSEDVVAFAVIALRGRRRWSRPTARRSRRWRRTRCPRSCGSASGSFIRRTAISCR